MQNSSITRFRRLAVVGLLTASGCQVGLDSALPAVPSAASTTSTTATTQSRPPAACGASGVALQVLGSGGPEIAYNDRASSGYLVWVDGAARVLIDAGAGTAANFGRSGARLEDLDAILLSHLHVDHSADLPALVKASYFGRRQRDLPLFGPTGNRIMPATTEYVASLLGEVGAFRYLSGYADPAANSPYNLLPQDLSAVGREEVVAFKNQRLELRAVPVTHGPLPALGWRVNVGSVSISFSGDMSGKRETFRALAQGSDLIVAHNAIPQTDEGSVTNLHMRPAMIGVIAAHAGPKQLVLSHRMRRTLGQEAQTEKAIREQYAGELRFADDLDCIEL